MALHAKNKHPVAMYSLDDNTNLKIADNYRCGPFMIWIHDIQHAMLGSALQPEGREFLFQRFIPNLMQYKTAVQDSDPGLAMLIQNLVGKADELDLTSFDKYCLDEKGPMAVYLNSLNVDINRSYTSEFRHETLLKNYLLGEIVEDRLFYLLLRLTAEAQDRGYYQQLFPAETRKKWKDGRGVGNVEQLMQLANKGLGSIDATSNVSVKDWQGLLAVETKPDATRLTSVRR